MDIYQHRRERLLTLIDTDFGGERVRFCDRTEISESRLAQLLSKTYRDGTAFTEKTARKLEGLAGLPAMYFDQGAIPSDEVLPAGDFKRVHGTDEYAPELTQIMKVKLRVQAGMTGFQTEPEHYDGDTQGVPTKWMQKQGLQRDSLLAIVVRGESMEPALHEGDVIVVNTADKSLVDGSVYVVNYEGEAVVKRMQRDAGQWWLSSDNADQRKYHRKLCKGAECIVIGKVIRKESTHI